MIYIIQHLSFVDRLRYESLGFILVLLLQVHNVQVDRQRKWNLLPLLLLTLLMKSKYTLHFIMASTSLSFQTSYSEKDISL